MDNDDVILWLVPYPTGSGWNDSLAVVRSEANRARLHECSSKVVEPELETDDRSTLPPEERPNLDNTDSLVLRFSDEIRNGQGIVAGRDPTCDIQIDQRGISNRHIAFAFDGANPPVVKDLGSRFGTKVNHPHMSGGEKPSKNEIWLLAFENPVETSDPDEDHAPVVFLTWNLAFQIRLPSDRDFRDPNYVSRVDEFRRRQSQLTAHMTSLRLQAFGVTEPATGQLSPAPSGQTFYKRVVKSGAYGKVELHINGVTGEHLAVKMPLKNDDQSSKTWLRESKILKHMHHPHIIEYRNFTVTPMPTITMAWAPGKSLRESPPERNSQTVEILIQMCSALEYLHCRPMPIAHRDIKPDNIMVSYNRSGVPTIKLIDFGLAKLSRSGAPWLTFCGTPAYMAPEFEPEDEQDRPKYGVSVDIWAAGLVIMWILCDLPEWSEMYTFKRKLWSEMILAHSEWHREKAPLQDGLHDFVADNMLVADCDQRSTANSCLKGAQELKKAMADSSLEYDLARPSQGSDLETLPMNSTVYAGLRRPSESSRSIIPSRIEGDAGAFPRGQAYTTSSSKKARLSHSIEIGEPETQLKTAISPATRRSVSRSEAPLPGIKRRKP